MRHGSLFSGIGGFDLAAQWAGWTNVFHCEINPFCQKILNHYWPDAETFTDITKTDFSKYEGAIDIISGGFPCQPYSMAGKRLGKEDDRHLWPFMLDAIRAIKPRWVVGENVRGLVNWSEGLVFEEVHTDLEAAGYQVQAFILPAASVNAPHRRYRAWFIANACNQGLQGREDDRIAGGGRQERKKQFTGCVSSAWENFPTQSPVCCGDDGLPTELDGITFPKWRNESLKAYGNAVVPQVVFEIFSAINEYEAMTNKH